jgi:hypothetical protein
LKCMMYPPVNVPMCSDDERNRGRLELLMFASAFAIKRTEYCLPKCPTLIVYV